MVYAEGPEYNDIKAYNQGSGNIEINNGAKVSMIKQSGSGDVRINTNSDHAIEVSNSSSGNVLFADQMFVPIDVFNTGSGEVKFTTSASNLTVKNQGSGRVEALSANADEVHVTCNGSGDCSFDVSGILNAKIYGSGDVKWKGSGRTNLIERTGSGKLVKL